MVKNNIRQILLELSQAYSLFNDTNINSLIDNLLSSNYIVCCGAGRMGFISKAFSMRLSHLGLSSFFYQDTNLPRLSRQDMLIIASGSGSTQTMLNLAKIAHNNKVKVALITCNHQSPIAKIANIIVKLNTPTKHDTSPTIHSIQPMTSLTEQFLFIFYDALVLELIKKLQLSKDELWLRHSNLE